MTSSHPATPTDDPAAFTELIRRYDDRMRAVAYGMVGSGPAMDDALQDAYLKAWRARASFRGESAFSTWLHRIVVNTCLDHLRRRPALVSLDGIDPADPARGAEGRTSDIDALGWALAQIPADQRAAVLLVDGEAMSYAEAAEVLEVAEGTVASRVHRGRTELRRLLSSGESS